MTELIVPSDWLGTELRLRLRLLFLTTSHFIPPHYLVKKRISLSAHSQYLYVSAKQIQTTIKGQWDTITPFSGLSFCNKYADRDATLEITRRGRTSPDRIS